MPPLWRPGSERVARSHLTAFTRAVAETEGRTFADYPQLHAWSVANAPAFWAHVWDYCGVIGDRGARLVEDADRMPGARFFPDATLNFAANLLRRRDAAPAIIATTEHGRDARLTFDELHRMVVRAAAGLRRDGVVQGDRVAGIVGNTAEAVIAALAAATLGAIWTACSPDFGADGILDRFGQVRPRVLFGVDGYHYGGRRFECLDTLADVARRLPDLREVVVIPMLGDHARLTSPVAASWWDDWLPPAEEPPPAFELFPFDTPLYILYSSGTTGAPKCIVHGAGGTLIQHLKEHQIQSDVRAGDRVFYFTTTGWMMWHWLVSALASEATLVLYDGAPSVPHALRLFELADDAGITLFGTSARYIDAIRKARLQPRTIYQLGSVRTITSTGSPLAPESFDFVYECIKADVHLASIAGGTDIVSCFFGGNPNGAVWRGEIQCAELGMDVRVYDDAGRRVEQTPGELVCGTPFPCMPLGFWNDPDGARYRATYFERFPGVWWHGDWVETTAHDGYIILGRSDATLKPGGVRIGTADIYRQVEQVPEVLESLAVGQRWGGDERIVLFVRLVAGTVLDDELRARIADRIRTHASPRHVPQRIVQVADIPRTRSGKLVELAVRRVIHGEDVPNRDALANPEALDLFRDLPELGA
jgi:acetoacetyl-CoA synthetase